MGQRSLCSWCFAHVVLAWWLTTSTRLRVEAVRHAGIYFENPYKGEKHPGFFGPEANSNELDHLLLSSNQTQVTVFVMFYNPKCKFCKRLMPTWDQVVERFVSTPSVAVLKVDCIHDGRQACLDHQVQRWPTFMHFEAGHSNGRVYRGGKSRYDLEEWIHGAVDEDHKEARQLQTFQGCIGFRQTSGCNAKGAREPWLDRSCTEEVPGGVSGYCECSQNEKQHEVDCDEQRESFNCLDICVPVEGCDGWKQTAGCDPDGLREESKDFSCRRVVGKGASGYCLCSDGKRTALMTCSHPGGFTCEQKCKERVL